MKLPYFNYYPRDFIADTRHLSFEQRGVYRELLDFMWIYGDDCTLPDDPKTISGLLGLSPKKWLQFRAALVEGFAPVLRSTNGRLISKRLHMEFEKANKKSELRKQAALARWNSDDANAMQMHTAHGGGSGGSGELFDEISQKKSEKNEKKSPLRSNKPQAKNSVISPGLRTNGDANALHKHFPDDANAYANGMHPEPEAESISKESLLSSTESLKHTSAADAAGADVWFDGEGNEVAKPPPEKEQRYSTDFEAFWLAYPRPVVRDRGSKSDAYAVWKRMKASERRLATSAALKYRQSETAKREGGKFIPHEATWLRGKRWEVVQEASELPNEADTPPSWASWEKDAAGDWIPLRGDNNGKLPYGAEDHAEVTRLHRQRWEQESKRQKAARTPGPNGLHASDTLTHGGARA
jgi:uncharacterized protein YdaU (DUF1376 family)